MKLQTAVVDHTSRLKQRFVLTIVAALTPALAALACFPGVLSQDGPAHLYNAQILAASLAPDSPFKSIFSVRWQPLPNWAGHLLYVVTGLTFSPTVAERVVLSLTLLALATSTAWLKYRVSGTDGAISTAALAALIGMNVAWLFGFTSFILGASMFALTLGVWWRFKTDLTWPRTLLLAGLLVAGYFCHPVSLGLTVCGLLVLMCGERANRRILIRTIIAILPLIPLGLLYREMTKAGGPMQPIWGHLPSIFSPRAWVTQFGWVDPISLAAKFYRPFGTEKSAINLASAPVIWLVAGLVVLAIVTARSRDTSPERKWWGILGGFLLFAGLISPDTLGESHGNYLPQRIVLLGLVALLPWLKLDAVGRWAVLGRGCLFIAFTLQSLFVWDYAQESNRTAGPYIKMGVEFGRYRRVAALLLSYEGRFRSNPMLHADCFLGVGTDHIIWGDYETNHYYFPVQLLDPATSPSARTLEEVSRLDGEANAPLRRELWTAFLDRYHTQIDVVLVWGNDPAIDAITARFYTNVGKGSDGKTQFWIAKK